MYSSCSPETSFPEMMFAFWTECQESRVVLPIPKRSFLAMHFIQCIKNSQRFICINYHDSYSSSPTGLIFNQMADKSWHFSAFMSGASWEENPYFDSRIVLGRYADQSDLLQVNSFFWLPEGYVLSLPLFDN